MSLSVCACQSVRYFNDLGGSDGHTSDDTADGDAGEDTDTQNLPCGETLLSRLTVTEIEVSRDVNYAEQGYDYIAVPSRIALHLREDGTGYAAWTDKELSAVYVTPLDENLERSGDDIEVEGNGLGGFVAMDDGFALLTRRTDQGEDPAYDETDSPGKAVVWVRRQGDDEMSSALTGTLGADGVTDYNNVGNFRADLIRDGDRFAAYFEIRGGVGHSNAGYFGDKLVFLDNDGAASTQWTFLCHIMSDASFVRGDAGVMPLCMSDRVPGAGFNLLFEDGSDMLLSEETTFTGYSGGALGGMIKMADGTYVAAWSSRRWDGYDDSSADDAHDIALLRMTSDFEPIGAIKWITETEDVDEVNLHIAPYGQDRILLSWNEVENFTVRGETCFGDFRGTFFQTLTPDGLPLSEPEALRAPMTRGASPFVYSNGDLAWAFADPSPNYSTVLVPSTMEETQTIYVAHFKYCALGSYVL